MVLAGLPGSDIDERLADVLTTAALAGRRALLVVPSSAHAARARSRLAATTPIGVRAISLGRLVESEWLLQGDGRSIVGDLHRDVLLSRALSESGVAERPGPGAIALLRTLVSRVCAQGKISHAPRGDGLGSRLICALEAYLAALDDECLVESSEAIRLLAACAPPADVIALQCFTALSPDRLALVRDWSRSGSEVIVALPWRDGCAATQPLDALVAELKASGATVAEASGPDEGLPMELRRVATELFSAGGPVGAQGSVVLGIARGDEAEARLVADRVKELLAEGVSGDRIAVAFPDPAHHVAWLRREFDRIGVEAVWDVRVPVPETPLGRSMLRLWSLSSGPMTREDFAAFLRSPFGGVDASRADRADISWRTHRIQGRGLLGLAGSAGRLVSLCTGLAAQPITPDSANKWKSAADELVANAYGHDAPVPGMEGALDAAVHRAFCQALSAASATGMQLTPREMWAAFALATVSPALPAVAGGVHVTSMRQLGLRDFDAVIIGGLTAGETLRQGSDDRLEGEAVREVTRAFEITHEAEDHVRAERLAFYLAATVARSSLMLVRRESDDEGRVLRPSVFWDEFLDLYREPGEDLAVCQGLPRTVALAPDVPTTGAGGPRAMRGVLQDEQSLRFLAGIDSVSPGEIERYTGCPYRWFVERRLRTRTIDSTVDVLTAGQVAHAALAEFYRRWPDVSGHRRVMPQDVDLAMEQMRTISAEAVCAAPAPTTLEEEWLLSSVGPSVAALVARDARFLPDHEPTYLEWSFGLGDGDEPIDLGGVRIKGRADRIDVGPQGLVVIDYKRSTASSLAQIKTKGLVQLQLYAVAASRRLGLPVAGGLYRSLAGEDDRGFVLEGVSDGFKALDTVDAAGMQQLLDEAVQTARDALSGMRAGNIEPSPAPERCKHCPALPFCPQGVRS